MLMALLLGMALNFLSQDGTCQAGIDFVARQLLRFGVGLLGLRITLDQVTALGWKPVLMVVVTVALTIGIGAVLALVMGFRASFGVLTGGAVAICGASAALAISAAQPGHPLKEKATLFTVIGVSTLSTVAMVLYPVITRSLQMNDLQAGMFIGGTIHDVAQVVGAGYSISDVAGDAATLIKLLRIAMLLPIIAIVAWVSSHQTAVQSDANSSEKRAPLLPGFAVAFAVFMVVNSAGWIPDGLVKLGQSASQWCLIGAMAAIGMKTHLKEVLAVGWKPVALMLIETVALALMVYVILQALAA
ncbi:hypothetical protein FQZ97_798020 [compost metagenome]